MSKRLITVSFIPESLRCHTLMILMATCLLMVACEPPADTSAETGLEPAASVTKSKEPTSVDASTFPSGAKERVTRLYQSVKNDPDNANKNGLLAMFAHAHGQADVALEYYERAALRAPTQMQWPYLRGVLLTERGDNVTAVESLRQAQKINAEYPPLILRLAQLLLKEGQDTEAQELLTGLINKHPNYPEARWTQGQYFLEQGDHEKAIAELSIAVAQVPHYGSAHYALAGAYQVIGNEAKAVVHRELFEKHRNSAPASSDEILAQMENLRNTSKQAIIRAGQLSAAGKFNEAISVFLRVLQAEPDNAVAHINLIGLYGETGQFDKAETHYQEGLKVAGEAVKLHNNFGILLLKQKRYGEAVDAFRTAIKIDPDYATPYKYLGVSLQSQGQAPDALTQFQLAFEKDPLDFQAGYLLGRALMNDKKFDDAVRVFEKITTAQGPKTPAYLRALAQAHYSLGRNENARTSLERARDVAKSYNQTELVERIETELAQLAEAGANTP